MCDYLGLPPTRAELLFTILVAAACLCGILVAILA